MSEEPATYETRTGSSTMRVEHNRDNPYTMINFHVLEDATLSWEARGMLAYLLSKPDGWQVRVTDLIKQSPAGRGVVRRILKELESVGHLVRRRTSNKEGHFIWITTIYEVPIDDGTIDGESTDGSAVDIPSIDLPSIDPDILSEENGNPSPSGDAVQPALIQAISVAEKKESDHQGEDPKKTLELVLIDHFVEASRIERPVRRVKGDYRADQTRWRKPIQVIAGLVDWDTGESIRLLDATLERLLGGTMTVSSPLSLVETARSIKGEWARGQPELRMGSKHVQTVQVGGGQRWG